MERDPARGGWWEPAQRNAADMHQQDGRGTGSCASARPSRVATSMPGSGGSTVKPSASSLPGCASPRGCPTDARVRDGDEELRAPASPAPARRSAVRDPRRDLADEMLTVAGRRAPGPRRGLFRCATKTPFARPISTNMDAGWRLHRQRCHQLRRRAREHHLTRVREMAQQREHEAGQRGTGCPPVAHSTIRRARAVMSRSAEGAVSRGRKAEASRHTREGSAGTALPEVRPTALGLRADQHLASRRGRDERIEGRCDREAVSPWNADRPRAIRSRRMFVGPVAQDAYAGRRRPCSRRAAEGCFPTTRRSRGRARAPRRSGPWSSCR